MLEELVMNRIHTVETIAVNLQVIITIASRKFVCVLHERKDIKVSTLRVTLFLFVLKGCILGNIG